MLNCRVRCTDDSGKKHTKNKIYNVVNGRLKSDNSDFELIGFYSIEQMNRILISQFELVEEETLKEKFVNMAKEEPLVFEDADGEKCILWNDKFLYNIEGTYSRLKKYNDDLVHKYYKQCSILKIYKTEGNTLTTIFKKNNLKLIWEREEDLPMIELTFEDIAKKYGVKSTQIKIIKDTE